MDDDRDRRDDDRGPRRGRRTRATTLERASENVLGGWPTTPSDDPPSADPEPGGRVPTTEAGSSASACRPSRSTSLPRTPRRAVPRAPVREAATPPADASSEHAPGALTIPPGYSVLEGEPSGERRAVGIVVSRFNGESRRGCSSRRSTSSTRAASTSDSITVMPVPGAFELPLAAMALAKTRRFACIVALGCVIRGDTPHFDYVAGEAASGLQLAAIETGVPVAFGVLTLERARPGGGAHREGRRGGSHRARDGRPVREPARGGRELVRVSGGQTDRDLVCGVSQTSVYGRVRYHAQPHVQGLRHLREEAVGFGNSPERTRWSPRSGASTRTSRRSGCARRQGDARLRLHALPQGRQGHQSRLSCRARLDSSAVKKATVALGESESRADRRSRRDTVAAICAGARSTSRSASSTRRVRRRAARGSCAAARHDRGGARPRGATAGSRSSCTSSSTTASTSPRSRRWCAHASSTRSSATRA